MSLDSNTLVKLIKRAAVDAVQAKKPMSMCLGEVTQVNPLKIQLDSKMVLTEPQLILTNSVRDFKAEITKSDTETDSTEETGTNSETNAEKQLITVHLALKTGEKVILLRCDGGQKFIVLDRAEVRGG